MYIFKFNFQIGEMAGIAIGMTLLIGVLIAGYVTRKVFRWLTYNSNVNNVTYWCRPISGGSLNPARTIGPALILHKYTALWIYIVGPIFGAMLGGFVYNLIRFTDKPLKEVAKASATFIKSASRVW